MLFYTPIKALSFRVYALRWFGNEPPKIRYREKGIRWVSQVYRWHNHILVKRLLCSTNQSIGTKMALSSSRVTEDVHTDTIMPDHRQALIHLTIRRRLHNRGKRPSACHEQGSEESEQSGGYHHLYSSMHQKKSKNCLVGYLRCGMRCQHWTSEVINGTMKLILNGILSYGLMRYVTGRYTVINCATYVPSCTAGRNSRGIFS